MATMTESPEAIVKAGGLPAFATTAELLVEAVEIETKLRGHVLELLEPTIQKQKQTEVRFKQLKASVDSCVAEVSSMKRATEGQDSLRGMVEGFQTQLAEWDNDRREHERQLGDRVSFVDIEINELRKSLSQHTNEIESNIRCLKGLSDGAIQVREEIAEVQRSCETRLDLGRDKLAKLWDEFETRGSATMAEQHQLRDAQATLEKSMAVVRTEVRRTSAVVDDAQATVQEMRRNTATLKCVEQQQHEFSEFARRVDGTVHDLGKQFGTLVEDVKAHFQTASEVLSQTSSGQINALQKQHRQDVVRMDEGLAALDRFLVQQKFRDLEMETSIAEVKKGTQASSTKVFEELRALLQKNETKVMDLSVAVQQAQRQVKELVSSGGASKQRAGGGAVSIEVLRSLVESSLLSAVLEVQDDKDRKSVALYGCKVGGGQADNSPTLPPIDGSQSARGGAVANAGAARAPIMSLDKRCLSCGSSQATVLSGFKLACLNYAPSPVEYQKVVYERSDLIRLRMDLLKQVKEQLRLAET